VLPEHTVELLNGEGDHRLGNRPIHLDDLRDDPRLLCLILRARGEQRGLDDQLGTLVELRSVLRRDHVVMAIELADHDVDRTVVFHCLAPVRWGEAPVSTSIIILAQNWIFVKRKRKLGNNFFSKPSSSF